MVDQATRLISSRSPARADTLQPLRVRYYKKMRHGLVHVFQVSWKKAERGVPAREVTLKLQIAGAQVVPAEQTLNPADPEASAKFFVTPLAQGKLCRSALEVFYQGDKIHEMPLPCKVVSHGRTWVYLLLTFLLPALLLYFCKYHPYLRDGLPIQESMARLITENLPDVAGLNEAIDDWIDVEGWIKQGIAEVAGSYAALCGLCRGYPGAFYTGAAFFLLTVLSAWRGGAKSKRRQGVPIRLPESKL